MKQLSLFEHDVFGGPDAILSDMPHPLIVAERWGFKLSYVDQDGNKDHYLYAGLEWFRGLGGERKGWSRVKNQLSLSARQLPFTATDGKTYQIDFVTQDDLYRIAMDMRQTAKRPQLKEQLQTSNPRDKMSIPALNYLSTAEWICSQRLGDAETLTFQQAREIIQDISAMIGAQADEVEWRMGIDVVTGRKLLGPIDAIMGLPGVAQ